MSAGPVEHAPDDDAPLSAEARRAAGAGARWGIATATLVQASTVVSTVAASRLLDPPEFAIVAATNVMAGLWAIISASGQANSALVGDRDDHDANSTMFWAATAVGLVTFGVAMATAPITARLIGHPEATATIVVAALAIPFTMAGDVVQSVFFRRLRYGWGYSVDAVYAVVTAVGPVALLLAGWGAWGVIVPRALAPALALALLMTGGRWRPSRRVDRGELSRSTRFSARMLGLYSATYVQSSLDYWVVGRVVPAAEFSAYYLAFVLPSIVRQRVTWTINGLITPLLVRSRHDPAGLRAVYGRAVRATTLMLIPVLVGISVTADLVVRVAFGPQWDAAVAPLRILAVVAAIDVSSRITNPVFMALQQPGEITRRTVVQAVALAVALVPVAFTRSITSAAWAAVAAVIVGATFAQVSLDRAIGFSLGRLARLVGPVVVAATAMAVSVVAVRAALPGMAALLELGVSGITGGVVYLAVLRLAFPGTFAAAVRDARALRARRAS